MYQHHHRPLQPFIVRRWRCVEVHIELRAKGDQGRDRGSDQASKHNGALGACAARTYGLCGVELRVERRAVWVRVVMIKLRGVPHGVQKAPVLVHGRRGRRLEQHGGE